MDDPSGETMTDRPRIAEQRAHERPHVLIVSDDAELSAFLSEGLPLGGFWTSVIASGLQALEVFRLRQFDLIVLEEGLRSFDALEFLRRLRGQSTRDVGGTARTAAPVITITEGASRIEIEARRNLDVAASLSAPLELDEVVRELHRVFASWRSGHPDAPLADVMAMRDA